MTCSYCGMIYKSLKPKECTRCGKAFGAGRDRRRHILGDTKEVVKKTAAYRFVMSTNEHYNNMYFVSNRTCW